MDTILGIRGIDFAMLATDTCFRRSFFVMRDDLSKIRRVSSHLICAVVGDPGDSTQFIDFISRNIQLYKVHNGYDLKPRSVASYTRRSLADYLRSRTPYKVNMYFAGFDPIEGAGLYYMDFLATAIPVPYGGHGHGAFFSNSIFDRYWHRDITENQAYDLLQKCVNEVNRRLVFNFKNFNVTVVNKDGIRDLPLIQYDYQFQLLEVNNPTEIDTTSIFSIK